MRLIVLSVAFLIQSSCSSNKITIDCYESTENIDQDFCKMFNNAMQSFQTEDSLTLYSRTYSMVLMEAVTGIPSRANDFHHPFYKSSRLLHEDLKKWSIWFEKNKHNWTKSKADSVILIFAEGN